MCAADIHSFLSLKPIIYSMLLLKRGPSFSEKLKFGVGGNTLIKAKKKSIYARGRSYRDSVLNIDAEPKPLFFNMKNKFSGITGWD